MKLIQGKVRHYAWGDTMEIPRLLGVEGDGRPWAEWWLGTHPGAPSTVDGQPLAELAGELPFLVKLLAAAEPLSLQTHPSREQAAAGFDREEAAGIPRDDPRRVYVDRSDKPEMLCALGEFDALCGFAPVERSLAMLSAIGAGELAAVLDDHGLVAAVGGLYERTVELAPIVEACAGAGGRAGHEAARLVVELATRYPEDPSVAVTLLLNRVHLQRGEAIHLDPGNLHAYLHGTGVEVMAASDNVVRGGMTDKHVDVAELLAVLDARPLPDPVVRAAPDGPGWRYPTPGSPFTVWRYDQPGTAAATGPELWLCVRGETGGLHQGQCAYLDAGDVFDVSSSAEVFRVGAAQ
jgi:mannose-6-phosphate isomerase